MFSFKDKQIVERFLRKSRNGRCGVPDPLWEASGEDHLGVAICNVKMAS